MSLVDLTDAELLKRSAEQDDAAAPLNEVLVVFRGPTRAVNTIQVEAG
jgi:hypothetical protein